MSGITITQWDKAMRLCVDSLNNRYKGDPIFLAKEAMGLPVEKQCQALDFMEEAPPNVREAFNPIWKYCFAQWIIYDAGVEAIAKNASLEAALSKPELIADANQLAGLVECGGFEKGPKSEKWTWKMLEKFPKAGSPDDDITPIVQAGKEERSEGVAAFGAEHYVKAFFHFCQGIRILARLPEPMTASAAKLAADLYKNASAAALKLDMFRVALNTANAALTINVDDQKAWFRKACALEKLELEVEAVEAYAAAGFGDPALPAPTTQKQLTAEDFQSQETKWVPAMQKKLEALVFIEIGIDSISAVDMIEELSEQVGGAKIPITLIFDCPTVGDALTELEPQVTTMSRGLLARAFWQAIGNLLGQDPLQMPEYKPKMLTDEKATGILMGLTEAFEKPQWQAKAQAVAKRSGYDYRTFLLGLRRSALDVQHPTLESRGFQANYEGVRSLQCAIIAVARQSQQVKELVKSFRQALYGGPNVMGDLVKEN